MEIRSDPKQEKKEMLIDASLQNCRRSRFALNTNPEILSQGSSDPAKSKNDQPKFGNPAQAQRSEVLLNGSLNFVWIDDI